MNLKKSKIKALSRGWDSPMQQDRLGAGSPCRKGLEDPGGQQLEQESVVSRQEKKGQLHPEAALAGLENQGM